MEAYQKKRKRRKRKKLWLLLLLVFLTVGGFTGYFLHEKQLALAEEAKKEVVPEEGQELVYGQITQITGNEMELEVVEAGTAYSPTGEARSYTIPVGTQVETKLGSVTTFSRLAGGDVVKLLLQQDGGDGVILKMWIVE